MKRDLTGMAAASYDLLIVGGGIYGIALAREAALNGFSVALVEKDDFCGAASASSLKTIHGGLRYLQQMDLFRFFESVRERRFFFRAAPHEVGLLPCAMPTRGHAMKGPEVMRCGLLLNDILSAARNRGVAPAQYMGGGRVVTRAEWLAMAPALDDPRYNGAACWYDGQAFNTERLALDMLKAAVAAGAAVANYAEAVALERRDGAIVGAQVRDRLDDAACVLRARCTVLCGGTWVRELLGATPGSLTCPQYQPALGFNLVLRKLLIPNLAVGLTSATGRLLFLVPWRGRTVAGTYYRLHEGSCDSMRVTGGDVDTFLADLNSAYPPARLTRDDVTMVQAGVLPCDGLDRKGEPAILRHYRIVDHARTDNTPGLVTMVGVKYTTARDIAARVVRQLAPRLGARRPLLQTDAIPLPGGESHDRQKLVEQAIRLGAMRESAEDMARHYGAGLTEVLGLCRQHPSLVLPLSAGTVVTGAEVVHASRHEWVGHLSDVVMRRTALGSAGRPDDAALTACATLVARELGWDPERKERELAAVRATPCWGPFNE